jgi:MATE family multidrug resistance protein
MASSNRDEHAVHVLPTEASPLMGSLGPTSHVVRDFGSGQSHRVQPGKTVTFSDISTNSTWQEETKIGVAYAAPLIVTFVLQYSIDVSSVIVAGRLGKVELGAVSRK